MGTGVGNMGIPSSMSSNESKNDDVDECKNSTSPSVSSPGSHRSDSSLELEAKTQPWVSSFIQLTINQQLIKCT